MNQRLWLPAFAIIAVFLLCPATGAGQAGPPAAASDEVKVPDSRGWNVEQAVVNLRSSDKGTRLASLKRLAKEPGPSIQKWIAEAAQYDPEPRIRYEAVLVLDSRNEPESLPVLMFVGENDKDDRVRTAARTAAGMGQAPAGQQGAVQPATGPQPAKPTTTQPAPPVKRYDASGNELPPGYVDEDIPAAKAEAGEGSWGATVEVDEFEKTKKAVNVHSGFMRQMGYDGPMGAPRDALTRSAIGLDLAFGRGVFLHRTEVPSATAAGGSDLYTRNEFTDSDFNLVISGSWSPISFLEIGLEIEALTAESRKHQQAWHIWDTADDAWREEPLPVDEDDAAFRDNIYRDVSYKGAAFGLMSLNLKTIFVDQELLRLGLAVRLTFPTHTGERFDSGLGSHDLFLPSSAAGEERLEHQTKDGTLWGLEPGLVASLAPARGLTIYTDIMFMVGILGYTKHSVERNQSDDTTATYDEELRDTNMYLVPHIGAQYRILDDSLGFQVALSPAIYLGKAAGAGLAGFGIVPGVSYRIIDSIDVALTVDIETGQNASSPFQCTGLFNDPNHRIGTTPCGVGRTVGFDLHVGYDF